ncbi:MAG: hypothetical protein AVDCRST_MAG48-531, partial [uncultured Friedmanniella sp.]
AGGHDQGLRPDQLGDGRGGQVALAQLGRLEGDGQLGGVLPGDLDLPDAVDLGQLRHGDVGRGQVQLGQVGVGGDGEDEDRDVVGAARLDRHLGVVGEGGHAVRGGADGRDRLVVVEAV